MYRSNRHLWLTLYWTTNLCNTYCYLAAHRAIQFHGQSWISIAENERISWHVTMQNSAGYLNLKWLLSKVATNFNFNLHWLNSKLLNQMSIAEYQALKCPKSVPNVTKLGKNNWDRKPCSNARTRRRVRTFFHLCRSWPKDWFELQARGHSTIALNCEI